jgi:aryl sulfotransferase
MTENPWRYRSPMQDSARWLTFPFRAGDIVISTRAKTGTTWLQMICALLIFQTPQLPAPLGHLSPWFDDVFAPLDELNARLAAQRHRRFIKTHTPLDGLPARPGVSYIVTGRHPLDAAVSLYHQRDNVDLEWVSQFTAEQEQKPAWQPPPRTSVREWLLDWIAASPDPRAELDSLPGVMWHMSGAWARRGEPDVILVHYDDLIADLGGQMRRLAGRLGIAVPEPAWPALVRAATFESMRAEAASRPASRGMLKDPAAFFRRGSSGAAREILTQDEIADYHARVARLAPPDLLDWLHSGGGAPGR